MASSLPQERRLIATTTQSFSIRFSLFVNLLVILAVIFFGIPMAIRSLKDPYDLSLSVGWIMVVIGLFGGIMAVRTAFMLKHWKHIEQHRLAAATRDRRWLATVQPISGEPLPSLPLRITFSFKRMHLWVVAILICGSLGSYLGSRILLTLYSGHLSYPLDFFFAVLMILLPILFFIPFFLTRTTIEATNDALKGSYVGSIPWQDALLFTCYKLPNFLGRTTSITYELASKHTVISWTWFIDPQAAFMTWEPPSSIEDHHQQMQALCNLVTARTGLPLYDLSRQPIKEEATTKE